MKKNDPDYNSNLMEIAKNSGLGIAGHSFFLIIRFALIIIITRNLGPGLYGVYLISLSVLEIAVVVSKLGLGATMIRFVARYIENSDYAKIKALTKFCLKTTLISSIFVSVIVFLSTDLIANRIFHKPDLASSLRIAILGLPFLSMTSIILSYFNGARILKYRILIEKVLRPLLRFMFTAIALGIGLNLYGVLWAWIMAIVIIFLFAVCLLRNKFMNINKYPAKIPKKEIFTYSLPLWFSIIINKNNRNIGIVLIGAYLTSEQVGIYGIGFRMMPYLLMPFFAYNAILAPMISALFTRNEIGNLEKIYKTGSRWVITLTLPVFVLMVIFSKQICSIFGSDFSASAGVMVILLTAQMVNISTGSSHHVLTMTGKSSYALMNSIFYFLSNIVLTIVMLKLFGLIGAAFGFGISIILLQLIQLIEVWTLYHFHPYSMQHLKPIVACASSVAILFFLKNVFLYAGNYISTILVISIFITTYALLLKLFGLSEEDKILLSKVKEKILKILGTKKYIAIT